MAVTKIWAIHDSVSRVVEYCSNSEKTRLTDLEQVLIYAANKAKTLDEGEQSYAVSGVNCTPDTAIREMTATQKRFGKTGGNVAYHAYQSLKTGEVSAAECHQIGLETARRLWGDNYQVLVATHFNTGTYHNHFVVNSVGMWDGKKLELNYFNETRKQELDKMIADFSDEGCMFVEDMFTEFNACFRRGYDRSNGRMTVSFGDELGNDLTFILSREEIEYVTAGVTEKLDNLVCDSFAPYDGDDAEESTIRLTPVNTEKELDMLLIHVLGDDGGGADD